MNKQKWLIVGLSLAMAATLGVGISACGGDKDPDTPPTPTEHTHTYDAWDYNETQHWKYCDEHGTDKSNIDESTKANHSFGQDGKCECGYEEPAIYLVGKIASKPTSKHPSEWQQLGNNVTEEVRKNCIKMELGEDGKTYEVEVLLSANDGVRIFETASGNSYPNAMETSRGATVEENNGYIVSWKPGDAKPTFRVHDHKFEKYASDASQHWKICTLDGTVEPDVKKQDHDFSNGDCVCGQKAPEACQHENGYAFAYETLPEASAEGGTLQKTCPDCHDTESLSYKKGFGTEANATTGPGTGNLLTEAGTYYFRGCNGFRFETTTAGTYIIRFAGKLIPTTDDVSLYGFHIGSSYAAALASTFSAIGSGQSSTKYNDEISKYDVQISGYESGQYKQFESLTFTVKDSDVAAGAKVCVQILFREKSATVGVDRYGYLITIECPAATAINSPAEVAMLPEKKD